MTSEEAEVAYPEHAKIMERVGEHEAIVSFLNYLDDTGVYLHRVADEQTSSFRVTYDDVRNEEVVAAYFDVDLKEFEHEKQRMLGAIREEADQ